MTKEIPESTRQYGWIDLHKRDIPAGRVIFVRLSVKPEHRVKYGGKWFLPMNVVRKEEQYLVSENGEFWRKVKSPKDVQSHLFQWRDIPGTPMSQAIKMAERINE